MNHFSKKFQSGVHSIARLVLHIHNIFSFFYFINIAYCALVCLQDYGYTRFKAENKTHIHFEQVSVDKNGSLIDSLWIVKDESAVYGRKNWAEVHAEL